MVHLSSFQGLRNARLLRPRAPFARASALFALHPPCTFLSACPAQAHNYPRARSLYVDPLLRAGCMRRAAMIPLLKSGRFSRTYLLDGWVATVAPSRNPGALRFVFPGPHTLHGEGSAGLFSEVCPANGWNPRAKTTLKLTTHSKISCTRRTCLI